MIYQYRYVYSKIADRKLTIKLCEHSSNEELRDDIAQSSSYDDDFINVNGLGYHI